MKNQEKEIFEFESKKSVEQVDENVSAIEEQNTNLFFTPKPEEPKKIIDENEGLILLGKKNESKMVQEESKKNNEQIIFNKEPNVKQKKCPKCGLLVDASSKVCFMCGKEL